MQIEHEEPDAMRMNCLWGMREEVLTIQSVSSMSVRLSQHESERAQAS